MQKLLAFLIPVCFAFTNSYGQMTRYIVKLKDKNFNTYSIANPAAFLTAKSIQRRAKYNINIDSTDLPITSRYLDSIRMAGAVNILNTSKWLNQVLIQTTDATALAKINAFPFVMGSMAIAPRPGEPEHPVNKKLDPEEFTGDFPGTTGPASPSGTSGYYNYGRSNGQVKIHNGDFLHNHGFRGEGIHMAIMDAGFFRYLTLPNFDSVRLQNRLLGTWDFVANEASVDEDNAHGMQCFSVIASNLPGSFVGTAPNASFYLYRTEDVSSEYPIEEQNYAAALERADSLGVDITSTSLGYYTFDNPSLNYTYADMNGNTSISARAADFAAKKGIMMVIAAGNEGNNSWHYLITPSDADSVMAVGAVDTLGNVASFTSYGPSSDGQVKPSVASVGLAATVASTGTGQPVYSNGTSFACPNMAGLTTCLLQAFPGASNMQLIDVIQQSATKSSAPDNRVGYGIPDMKKAFVILQKRTYTQQATINNCKIELNLSLKTGPSMRLVVERKLPNEQSFSNIGQLQHNGNFSLQNFQYTDLSATGIEGLIHYRVKMEIASDTSYYLDSLSINFPASCIAAPENKITIGPNPTDNVLYIQITRIKNTGVKMVLQNASGQKILSENYTHNPGLRLRTLSLNNLAKGMYILSVWADNEKWITQQIIKN